MWIKDTTSNKSITATAFVVGFVIVNLKLLVAGLTLAGISFSPFSGSDYGIAVGALGAIYVLRRATGKEEKKDVDNS